MSEQQQKVEQHQITQTKPSNIQQPREQQTAETQQTQQKSESLNEKQDAVAIEENDKTEQPQPESADKDQKQKENIINQQLTHQKDQSQNRLTNQQQQQQNIDNQSQIYQIPPTPQQLLKAQLEHKEKQKLINEIMKMYDDFERLQLRSEQLQQQNQYFVDKINEYENIVYEQDQPTEN